MSVIGKLKRVQDSDGECLLGSIQTLEYDLSLKFYPTGEAADSRSPAYRIFVVRSNGTAIEIGGAWLKTVKRETNFGDEFLSISIDDPSFPQPLNVAAFKDKDGTGFDITFRRRKNIEA